jgi:arylsulfatase A-like enzyme
LILNGPANSGIVKRSVLNQVIELRDIMPTLLDCAGLSIPESVEGRSFLPMARGQNSEWRSYLHGEHVYNPGPLSTQWLTDGKEKYIWFSTDGSEQLFDLEKDPTELHDLAQLKSSSERMNYWRKILIEELQGRPDGFTDGQRLIAGRPVNPVLPHLREKQ